MSKVYSMGGIERVIDGDTVRVSVGDHTTDGYVARTTVTVRVRESDRLSAKRFSDLFASALGQVAPCGGPVTREWADAVCRTIAREHASETPTLVSIDGERS